MTKDSKLHQYDRAFGLPVLDILHERIHRGEVFTASAQQEIAGDGTADFLIRVVGGMHVTFTGNVGQNMLVSLFEGPTTSADGVAVTPHNRNRFSSTTPTTLVFAGPTVSADGTQLFDGFAPGGEKQSASGGQASSFFEWVLSPGDYIARIENTIVSPAAAAYAGLVIDFYEPVSGIAPL